MKETVITELIPQRSPILLVDNLIDVSNNSVVTSLSVRPGLYFVDEAGFLTEPGVIEHIAQSASAFAGYKAWAEGTGRSPIGYIGEVKKFHCFRCPQIGEDLYTSVTMGVEVDGVCMLTGETRVLDRVVATTQMKIFIHNEE